MDVVLALLLGEKGKKGGSLREGGSKIQPRRRLADLFLGLFLCLFPSLFCCGFLRVRGGSFWPFWLNFGSMLESFGSLFGDFGVVRGFVKISTFSSQIIFFEVLGIPFSIHCGTFSRP